MTRMARGNRNTAAISRPISPQALRNDRYVTYALWRRALHCDVHFRIAAFATRDVSSRSLKILMTIPTTLVTDSRVGDRMVPRSTTAGPSTAMRHRTTGGIFRSGSSRRWRPIAKAFGVESRAPAMLAIVGILVFGLNFAVGRIDVGPLLFLGALAAGLIVVAVVSVRRMSDRNESGTAFGKTRGWSIARDDRRPVLGVPPARHGVRNRRLR